MRTFLALAVTVALAAPGHAGNDPTTTTRPARGESAPKAELERPSTDKKPSDGKPVCTYVDRDQNAPSERVDCIANREPAPQRPVEKTPPGPPGNEATPSAR